MRITAHVFLATFATFAALAATASLARADKTERTYQAKCASCHGEDGKGQTTKGKEMGLKDLSGVAAQKALTDDQIQKAIENGVDTNKDGKKQQMDGYKDKLKPEQITDLVKYVRTLAAK
jgi:cytochrome c6